MKVKYTFKPRTDISLIPSGRMRARKNAGMLCEVAGARREANKHQLQAGYSLQIMSFGHGWAIDVTILCFSNDAHVGHQLQISLLCCWHPFAVIVSPSLLVFVLAGGYPPRSHLAVFLFSSDAMQASWDLIRTRWTRCRNCPKGSENVGSCQACGESGILQ